MRRLFLIALIAGCAPPALEAGARRVPGCLTDASCPPAYLCVRGACQLLAPGCVTDADCDAAAGQVCEFSHCAVPVPDCTTDADCAPGDRCDTGSCVTSPPPPPPPDCVADTDCADGESCTAGACVPPAPACALDADCPTGERCTEGACVAPPPPPPECVTSAECANGDACVAGACVCTADTWDGYAADFFSTNCRSCHSFATTYEGVLGESSRIRAQLSSGNMPPNGGVSSAARARIVRWLTCDLPR